MSRQHFALPEHPDPTIIKCKSSWCVCGGVLCHPLASLTTSWGEFGHRSKRPSVPLYLCNSYSFFFFFFSGGEGVRGGVSITRWRLSQPPPPAPGAGWGIGLGRLRVSFPPSCKYRGTPETVYGAWSLIDVFVHYKFCSRIFFKTFAVFWGLFFFFCKLYFCIFNCYFKILIMRLFC